MSAYADSGDFAQVVRLTYNGRACGLRVVRVVAEGTKEPTLVVEALLPKGWDQGPPVVIDNAQRGKA